MPRKSGSQVMPLSTAEDATPFAKGGKSRESSEVSTPRGLFIVGNKRSGSTHLMRLLNLHREVFVSNESDVIWILYNHLSGKNPEPYPLDSPGGMEAALKKAGHILNRDRSTQENFEAFQSFLMRDGFLKQKGTTKKKLTYIGDQKPYQNIDPKLVPFILDRVHKPKFLHILRHPFEVVTSSMQFDGGTGGDIWHGKGPAEILDMWELHERRVLAAVEKHDIDLLTVRYDRLIGDTVEEMRRVYSFLNLPYSEDLLETCRQNTLPNFKKISNYPLTPSQRSLMRHYGLPTHFNWFDKQFVPAARKYFFKAKLKISEG